MLTNKRSVPGYGIPVSEPAVRSWLSDRIHIHLWQLTYSQEQLNYVQFSKVLTPKAYQHQAPFPTYSTPWRAAACSLDEGLSGGNLDRRLTKKTDKEEELQ